MLDIQSFRITRPTSAYEVLDRVARLVEDEPRRMHMSTLYVELSETRLQRDALLSHTYPPCGTIGCIAGWSHFVMCSSTNCGASIGTANAALLLAGFSKDAEKELLVAFWGGDHMNLPDGSQEQADAVCLFVRTFQAKYEQELRARIILPGGVVQE